LNIWKRFLDIIILFHLLMSFYPSSYSSRESLSHPVMSSSLMESMLLIVQVVHRLYYILSLKRFTVFPSISWLCIRSLAFLGSNSYYFNPIGRRISTGWSSIYFTLLHCNSWFPTGSSTFPFEQWLSDTTILRRWWYTHRSTRSYFVYYKLHQCS
jgi:hypothetical protein